LLSLEEQTRVFFYIMKRPTVQLQHKFDRLQRLLHSMNSALVAYSGGVDSSFLICIARYCIKDVVAVTAVSETYTKKELEFAKEFCRWLGVRHRIIHTHELRNKNFSRNPRQRCYYCKKELFSQLRAIARREKIHYLLDASNTDDIKDFRPGSKAKKEFSVVSPLQKAGLRKQDIRTLSRQYGLPSWNKPQMACLASRIPYNEVITRRKLRRIENAEDYLRSVVRIVGNIRVRTHDGKARIEVDKEHIDRLVGNKQLISTFRKLGFRCVTVDAKGFRSGSMNENMNERKLL